VHITTFEFEHAPEPEKPSDSGVLAGNQLVSSGQVVKHSCKDATITRLFGLWGVFELESGYIRVRTRPR
jgi:hypothetical protein